MEPAFANTENIQKTLIVTAAAAFTAAIMFAAFGAAAVTFGLALAFGLAATLLAAHGS